jgi:hypothetical protein
MNHNLSFPRDNFDQDNTFTFAYKGYKGAERTATGYLFNSVDEGVVYIMKQSAVLKDHYTPADIAESARLAAQTPVRTGDTVTVNGRTYLAKIIGNYSDAGRLAPIELVRGNDVIFPDGNEHGETSEPLFIAKAEGRRAQGRTPAEALANLSAAVAA